jgi:elongation factor P
MIPPTGASGIFYNVAEALLVTPTMAILAYNEILPKCVIEYEVLSSHIFRMQQRKPVNNTKLRHLISGRVIEISFHQNESMAEADIEKMTATYMYTNRGESWFSEAGNPKNRFSFSEDAVHDKVQWLKPNSEVEVMVYKEKPATLEIDIKVDLKVTEAAPAVKGDTVSGGSKQVTLESGATVQVPMFINEGDVLRINTETGDYVERVTKA